MKQILTQDREREKAIREQLKAESLEAMDVDGAPAAPLEPVFCESRVVWTSLCYLLDAMPDSSIEAPPSILPQKKYCDITGLEVGSDW